jgi:hypothetical protein
VVVAVVPLLLRGVRSRSRLLLVYRHAHEDM